MMDISFAASPLLLAPTVAALGDEPRKVLNRLGEAGFRAVQLSATQPGLRPRELDQSARRDLLATLRRRELLLAGLDLWIPSNHFIEPEHQDRAADATLAAIDLAADLGGCPLSLSLPAKSSDEADEANSVITTLAEHALHHGVALADHQLPVTTRPAVSLGIDTGAWLTDSRNPAEGILQHGASVASVRLCDISAGMRSPLGTRDGRLDLVAIRAALSVSGYERPVVLDARQWQDPWHGVEQSRDEWHG